MYCELISTVVILVINTSLNNFKVNMKHRMRKLTTGLLTSTQFHIPIRIMHGVRTHENDNQN